MNRTRTWISMVAVTVAAVVMVPDSPAQGARAKPEAYRPAAASVTGGGGVAGGPVRIRQFTGFGPRSLIKMPNVFPAGRAPSRDWAELQVVFDSEPEWIDEVSFQYYALLHDRVSDEYSFLRGQVIHVDVARGKGHMSSAYIRPNTLARMGEVVAVAVEVLVKGDIVAVQSEGKLPRGQALPSEWWKSPKLVPKDGLLLAKPQTPFAYVSYDDYEAVK